LAAFVYLALSVATTWPLARSPTGLLVSNPDVYGNAWAMAWVARQAFRDPLHLFDSNMFHPHAKTLAYAESLIPQGLQASPVLALSGSLPLAYNLVFFSTFVLSGLGAYLLARDLGSGRAGAFLAGLGFAFCAYRWDHLVHLQSLSIPWLPLALLFLRRTMRTGAPRDAIGLVVTTVLQALSSGYYALLVAIALGAAFLVESFAARRRDRIALAAGALAAAALLAAPVFAEHRRALRRYDLRREARELRVWSATPGSYLEPGGYTLLPHARWLHERISDREPLSPGLLLLVLGLGGAVACGRTREGGLALLLALLGVAFSLGVEWRLGEMRLPGPFSLIRLLPGGDALRTPSRFGILGVLGIDLLAALAFTRLQTSWVRGARRGPALFVAVAVFATLEAWPAGIGRLVKPAPPFPPSAAWLAQAPTGPVLELPWLEHGDSATHVYWSTRHWQPMINGFGSFNPPGNFGLALIGQRFPSPYTSRVLRAHGVRYVVIHMDRLPPAWRERVEQSSELPEGVRQAAAIGSDLIFEIDPEGPRARRGR
jgi:hypothetical protein